MWGFRDGRTVVEGSDADNSIVQEVFAFVRRNCPGNAPPLF
jgi:hypothetical protein